MTEEQKAQALALYRNERIRAAYGRHCPTGEISTTGTMDAEGRRWWVAVPNLADATGEVEGRLHRVLEKLVGADVEVVCAPQSILLPPEQWVMEWSCIRVKWRAMSVYGLSPRFNPGGYPTRLEAIVAALMEVAK